MFAFQINHMFEDAEFRDEVDNPWVEEGYDRLHHNYVSLIEVLNSF